MTIALIARIFEETSAGGVIHCSSSYLYDFIVNDSSHESSASKFALTTRLSLGMCAHAIKATI